MRRTIKSVTDNNRHNNHNFNALTYTSVTPNRHVQFANITTTRTRHSHPNQYIRAVSIHGSGSGTSGRTYQRHTEVNERNDQRSVYAPRSTKIKASLAQTNTYKLGVPMLADRERAATHIRCTRKWMRRVDQECNRQQQTQQS